MKNLVLALACLFLSGLPAKADNFATFGQQILQTSTTTLTSAQIQSMASTPIVVVPAPGANQTLQVVSVLWRYSGGTAYLGGAIVNLSYVGGAPIISGLPAAILLSSSTTDTIQTANLTTLGTRGAGLQVSSVLPFTTGTGTLTVIVQYTVQ